MKSGTTVVDIIDHLLTGFVKNNVDIAVNINKTIISTNPLRFPLPMMFAKVVTITTPILVFLKTLISIEANSMSIRVLPVPSNE